ncbi:hypothetical protein [Gordonia zhaorongruii]|uniref:hypothetical protein n=1 Tax=Gordonia zhaorongruii TaxID=2597659 RepID=UPI00104309B9|nr:hypothetical protein [Gordonia zhaorongruii]
MSAQGGLGWLGGFAIPSAPSGAVLALGFGDDGIWLARITGRPVGGEARVINAIVEPRIVPRVLDMRVAGELYESGRIDEASDPAVFEELTELVRRARTGMGNRDSILVMGTHALRFVSVKREEIIEGTVPEVNRLHGMIVELAGTQPVDAILLGPGIAEWPGLWESLTERGFSALLPGDPFPATFAGDDGPTNLLDRVEKQPVSLAWGDSNRDLSPLSFTASGIDPADYDLDRDGNVRFGGPALDGRPSVAADDDSPEKVAADRKRRRRTAVAAFAVILGLGGVGAAVAATVHERPRPSVNPLEGIAETASETTTEDEGPARIPTSVDRREVKAARAKMIEYSTPPPPPKTTQRTTDSESDRESRQTRGENNDDDNGNGNGNRNGNGGRQGAEPGPEPRPTQRKKQTIPNPIPGLPPIVIG